MNRGWQTMNCTTQQVLLIMDNPAALFSLGRGEGEEEAQKEKVMKELQQKNARQIHENFCSVMK